MDLENLKIRIAEHELDCFQGLKMVLSLSLWYIVLFRTVATFKTSETVTCIRVEDPNGITSEHKTKWLEPMF